MPISYLRQKGVHDSQVVFHYELKPQNTVILYKCLYERGALNYTADIAVGGGWL